MSFVKETVLGGRSKLSSEGKKKASDKLEKARKEDEKLVKGIFKNLEAPGAKYLERLSPTKKFSSELLEGLKKIAYFNEKKPLRAGITTQLVVGAAGETDKEIINFSSRLYEDYKLWRCIIAPLCLSSILPLKGFLPVT